MSLFPIIESENLVQEKDKTRISGVKSFVDSGNPITSIKVKPSKNAAEVTVTSEDEKDWYVDYLYDFTFDVDATNNELDFNESSGPELTATVATGEYTFDALVAALKAALDAAGGQVYTVSHSGSKITVSAPGDFSLLGATGSSTSSLYPEIGFSSDSESGVSAVGDEVQSVKKEVTLTVDDGASSEAVTKTIDIISEFSDRLWSTDSMLQDHEPDILRWIRDGRATFKNMHRLAQTQALGWLDKNGYVNIYNDPYTKEDFVEPEEMAQWSKFLVLRLIFDSISNQIDDIFFSKARQYQNLEEFYRDRAILRLDTNKDGSATDGEGLDIKTGIVVRR